ncbi:MAG: hypothetical protein HUJ57_05395 [Erysipelotrichaceae bacterium]|nr:hypothetical protein [Erysipelotrichaceae bacterium]
MLVGCSAKPEFKAEDLICEDHCKVLDVTRYNLNNDDGAVIYELDYKDYAAFMGHHYVKSGIMYLSGYEEKGHNDAAVAVLQKLAKEKGYPTYYVIDEHLEKDQALFAIDNGVIIQTTTEYSDDVDELYPIYKNVADALPSNK